MQYTGRTDRGLVVALYEICTCHGKGCNCIFHVSYVAAFPCFSIFSLLCSVCEWGFCVCGIYRSSVSLSPSHLPPISQHTYLPSPHQDCSIYSPVLQPVFVRVLFSPSTHLRALSTNTLSLFPSAFLMTNVLLPVFRNMSRLFLFLCQLHDSPHIHLPSAGLLCHLIFYHTATLPTSIHSISLHLQSVTLKPSPWHTASASSQHLHPHSFHHKLCLTLRFSCLQPPPFNSPVQNPALHFLSE